MLLTAVLLAAGTVATAVDPTGAAAQNRNRIVIGMQLEPPHLDPTAGAAAAIDEVTYANLFEKPDPDRCSRRGDSRTGGTLGSLGGRPDLHVPSARRREVP